MTAAIGIPKFDTGPQKSVYNIISAPSDSLTITPLNPFPFPEVGACREETRNSPDSLRGLREKGQRTRGADIAQHGIRPDLRVGGFDESGHGGWICEVVRGAAVSSGAKGS